MWINTISVIRLSLFLSVFRLIIIVNMQGAGGAPVDPALAAAATAANAYPDLEAAEAVQAGTVDAASPGWAPATVTGAHTRAGRSARRKV